MVCAWDIYNICVCLQDDSFNAYYIFHTPTDSFLLGYFVAADGSCRWGHLDLDGKTKRQKSRGSMLLTVLFWQNVKNATLVKTETTVT